MKTLLILLALATAADAGNRGNWKDVGHSPQADGTGIGNAETGRAKGNRDNPGRGN